MESTNAVALAAIALAASMGAGVVWIVKYLAKELSQDLKEHTKAAIANTAASKDQSAASKEVLAFMKKLNGKLETAVIQKGLEQ